MNKDNKPISIPSLLLGDKIIETILTDSGTRLLVGNQNGYEVVDHFDSEGQRYIPVNSKSDLFRNEIVTFTRQPLPYENVVTLHSEIKEYIVRYVTLPKQFLEVASAYVLLTWVYDAFAEIPYLRFQGDFGTGKTRALLSVGSLCRKPMKAGGASTISPIFHLLDKYQGTLILDEADFKWSDETHEIVKILNNGNMKGFPVLRSQLNKDKNYEPRAFSVYGPKLIAMRGSYEDVALESRFLTGNMRRGEKAPDIPHSLPKEMKEAAEVLTRKLLSYRLQNLHSIHTVPVLPELSDRGHQILGPLLAVAPTEEARAAILSERKSAEETLDFDRTWSLEGSILRAIVSLSDGAEAITIGAIAKVLRTQDFGDLKFLSHAMIGKTIRERLGLSLYKSRGVITLLPGQEIIARNMSLN